MSQFHHINHARLFGLRNRSICLTLVPDGAMCLISPCADLTMPPDVAPARKSEKSEPACPIATWTHQCTGRLDALKLGTYMAHHALRPDRAMVSDSQRTREPGAAEQSLDGASPRNFESELYNAGPNASSSCCATTLRRQTLLIVRTIPDCMSWASF